MASFQNLIAELLSFSLRLLVVGYIRARNETTAFNGVSKDAATRTECMWHMRSLRALISFCASRYCDSAKGKFLLQKETDR